MKKEIVCDVDRIDRREDESNSPWRRERRKKGDERIEKENEENTAGVVAPNWGLKTRVRGSEGEGKGEVDDSASFAGFLPLC